MMSNVMRGGALTLIVAPGIAACGGGGGSSFSPLDPTAPLTLTPANALDVAAEVEFAHLAANLVSSTLVPELEFGILADLVLSGASGTVAPQMVFCDFEGSATISGTLTGGQVYSPDDVFVVNFDDCRFFESAPALNGDAEIIVEAFTGSLSAPGITLVVTVEADALAATEAGSDPATATGTGTFLLAYESLYLGGLPVRFSQQLTSPALELSVWGLDFLWRDLESANAVQFTSAAPSAIMLATAGNLVSVELEGSVEIATPVTLSAPADSDPDSSFESGNRTITGNGATRIRLVPQDPFDVTLEVDSVGDGTPDTFIDTTWAELRLAPP